ncbi:ArsC/Spx/MgsR family protein [Sphingomonas sp. KR1UV-12]|uniref:ArsC/Spx/MgsR family protein n=1 Tax=Sphingomonas aurea TaxID=3063994 RepID=A0ABT9EFV8_9SPHN|nr:ArsC/Spx/MgsR family protein [Sphingomonas sp. KR1UV-12]MDP1025854.1 ArsC/Spx/MgsR family protein [Sphingomonas sp. KR1UV-12]
MKATIYHNPRCSKSRATLAILEEAGADVTVVEYLKAPLTADELARLYARAGMTPREGLRADAPAIADDAILAGMAANPAIIERPLVETDMGVVLARPPERVRDIMSVAQASRIAPR